jgi:hypothetical protein
VTIPAGWNGDNEWDRDGLKAAESRWREAFSGRENARPLEQLRAKAAGDERRKSARDVIQIQDEGLVDHPLELGLGPETILAVTLIPLAMVAPGRWPGIEPKEREAIQARCRGKRDRPR